MVTIRRAEEKDIPRILELYDELALPPVPSPPEGYSVTVKYRKAFAGILASAGHQLIVAEEKGRVVGSLALIVVPSLGHGGKPWMGIENVIVDSRGRRLGVGKMMMDYALAEAKKAGCYKMQLISDKRRTEAHKFYEAIGYTGSGVGFRRYL